MLKTGFLAFVAALSLFGLVSGASADVYELRTYVTNDDKLDALKTRFRDHTVRLFEKHGMESVGYWVPTEAPQKANTLIYVLRHKSREAAKASWAAFLADPEWKAAAAASERNGRILAKAPEAVYMELTDYSPNGQVKPTGDDPIYELRIYRCNEGQLANLDARFRNHTIGFFDKYGIASVMYWHPTDGQAAKDTLIYILRHESEDAAKASWAAFRADEAWKTVVVESQKDGPFLRETPESILMRPTDFSQLK